MAILSVKCEVVYCNLLYIYFLSWSPYFLDSFPVSENIKIAIWKESHVEKSDTTCTHLSLRKYNQSMVSWVSFFY